MSFGRILLAALLGGVVVFLWGYVVHAFQPPEAQGLRSLPAEEVVVPVLRSAITEGGLYVFPAFDERATSPEAMKAYEEKVKGGPAGMIIITPQGEPMNMRMLGTEFGSNVLCAFLLAVVLVWTRASRIQAAAIGLIVGVFAWLSIDVSYWNWHKFPMEFTRTSLMDQAAGWLFAGLVIGLVLGRPRPAAPVAP